MNLQCCQVGQGKYLVEQEFREGMKFWLKIRIIRIASQVRMDFMSGSTGGFGGLRLLITEIDSTAPNMKSN